MSESIVQFRSREEALEAEAAEHSADIKRQLLEQLDALRKGVEEGDIIGLYGTAFHKDDDAISSFFLVHRSCSDAECVGILEMSHRQIIDDLIYGVDDE